MSTRSVGHGPRSSVRSHGSSSTSNSGDPREKIKDCFRKLVAFMCTQVGVGGLIVCYAVFGALGFQSIETQAENNPRTEEIQNIKYLRQNCSNDLWQITYIHNVLNKTAWKLEADHVLKTFQDGFAQAVKKGYDGRDAEDIWSFPAALMFCLSIFTMIGYGNMVPQTAWGKGTTVLYAVFGIPLYVLYFLNMGEILAQTFRWLYTWFYECSTPQDEFANDKSRKRIIVPSTACLWVMSAYVLTGTIMFAEWEGWNYLDSTYFCVTSLCKIGFGDFVPGANILESSKGNQTKLIINFVYMLLGMGLVAMCYNLMREDVRVKVEEMREDLGQCMEDIRLRLVACANKFKSKDEYD
ncbi:TWiK family of potassium channels protein 18 [Chrysoperla carnea]|uniref:TWiK family of potassium channels protein 18 n=1 Tax=Chrysoperla carnea TaxID=189513 RepID=UPI001D066A7F|nr:TWiK family of potassium channels protein 18 [Chrysoperla carnea]XP_044736575.1 TWiK family of potassium channels protein 18 [Chrysoperla carnea]